MKKGRSWQSLTWSLLSDAFALRWLRIGPLSRFLQLYTYLLAILAVAVAGNLLTLFPSIRESLLTPLIVVDLDKFYNSTNDFAVPPSFLKHETGSFNFINVPAPDFEISNFDRDLGWKLYDVATGQVTNPGSGRGGIHLGIPDLAEEEVARGLGLPYPPRHPLERIEDSGSIRYHVVRLALGQLERHIAQTTGKNVPESTPYISLQEIESYLQPQERFEFRSRLRSAAEILSLILVENTSNLTASNVEVFFDRAGRWRPIEPLITAGSMVGQFRYSERTNSIWFSRLAHAEQLVIITRSQLAVEQGDVRVTWDRYSEVDSRKLTYWLVGLLIGLCLCLFIRERMIAPSPGP